MCLNCEQQFPVISILLPVDVIVFMHAVKLQFKATEQVLDHDPEVMVEDPGAETS